QFHRLEIVDHSVKEVTPFVQIGKNDQTTLFAYAPALLYSLDTHFLIKKMIECAHTQHHVEGFIRKAVQLTDIQLENLFEQRRFLLELPHDLHVLWRKITGNYLMFF